MRLSARNAALVLLAVLIAVTVVLYGYAEPTLLALPWIGNAHRTHDIIPSAIVLVLIVALPEVLRAALVLWMALPGGSRKWRVMMLVLLVAMAMCTPWRYAGQPSWWFVEFLSLGFAIWPTLAAIRRRGYRLLHSSVRDFAGVTWPLAIRWQFSLRRLFLAITLTAVAMMTMPWWHLPMAALNRFPPQYNQITNHLQLALTGVVSAPLTLLCLWAALASKSIWRWLPLILLASLIAAVIWDALLEWPPGRIAFYQVVWYYPWRALLLLLWLRLARALGFRYVKMPRPASSADGFCSQPTSVA